MSTTEDNANSSNATATTPKVQRRIKNDKVRVTEAISDEEVYRRLKEMSCKNRAQARWITFEFGPNIFPSPYTTICRLDVQNYA